MDLKVYYRKIRDTEAGLPEGASVVVSNETADGGKAGVGSEVPRGVAARMLVEGAAHIATAEEAQEYYDLLAERRQAVEQAMNGRPQYVTPAALEAKKTR